MGRCRRIEEAEAEAEEEEEERVRRTIEAEAAPAASTRREEEEASEAALAGGTAEGRPARRRRRIVPLAADAAEAGAHALVDCDGRDRSNAAVQIKRESDQYDDDNGVARTGACSAGQAGGASSAREDRGCGLHSIFRRPPPAPPPPKRMKVELGADVDGNGGGRRDDVTRGDARGDHGDFEAVRPRDRESVSIARRELHQSVGDGEAAQQPMPADVKAKIKALIPRSGEGRSGVSLYFLGKNVEGFSQAAPRANRPLRKLFEDSFREELEIRDDFDGVRRYFLRRPYAAEEEGATAPTARAAPSAGGGSALRSTPRLSEDVKAKILSLLRRRCEGGEGMTMTEIDRGFAAAVSCAPCPSRKVLEAALGDEMEIDCKNGVKRYFLRDLSRAHYMIPSDEQTKNGTKGKATAETTSGHCGGGVAQKQAAPGVAKIVSPPWEIARIIRQNKLLTNARLMQKYKEAYGRALVHTGKLKSTLESIDGVAVEIKGTIMLISWKPVKGVNLAGTPLKVASAGSGASLHSEIAILMREKKVLRLGVLTQEYKQFYGKPLTKEGKLKDLVEKVQGVKLEKRAQGKGSEYYVLWNESSRKRRTENVDNGGSLNNSAAGNDRQKVEGNEGGRGRKSGREDVGSKDERGGEITDGIGGKTEGSGVGGEGRESIREGAPANNLLLRDSGVTEGSQKNAGGAEVGGEDKLIKLTPDQAIATRFPPGCRVVCAYEEEAKACRIRIRMAVVASANISLRRRFVYEIRSVAAKADSEIDGGATALVDEDLLAYAPGVRVFFRPDPAEARRIAGTVLLAKRSGGDSAGEVRYTVLAPSDNDQDHVVHLDVGPEQLSFRADFKTNGDLGPFEDCSASNLEGRATCASDDNELQTNYFARGGVRRNCATSPTVGTVDLGSGEATEQEASDLSSASAAFENAMGGRGEKGTAMIGLVASEEPALMTLA
ncbi:hypothetical protein ACHAWF_017623 [Thalassiosira exigua]